jgi:hypothetical protein
MCLQNKNMVITSPQFPDYLYKINFMEGRLSTILIAGLCLIFILLIINWWPSWRQKQLSLFWPLVLVAWFLSFGLAEMFGNWQEVWRLKTLWWLPATAKQVQRYTEQVNFFSKFDSQVQLDDAGVKAILDFVNQLGLAPARCFVMYNDKMSFVFQPIIKYALSGRCDLSDDIKVADYLLILPSPNKWHYDAKRQTLAFAKQGLLTGQYTQVQSETELVIFKKKP